ncbi:MULTISPECIES: hypothetical protein [unclassified Microbacterium]|uniref:hypothetical protein n=1 Tax=unclassified Microbacterium TaxID=2609290 RepID=UPI0008F537B0|nr:MULTISPECIES: hypothetical protein [unclassified Microbacterium]OIJ33143.1 hypothetical protein BK819_04785 [Microbacterium sp. LCT-H2]
MSHRRWWLLGGLVAAVAVAGAVWWGLSALRSPTAEEAALAYLHALESGDPEAVAATGTRASDAALTAFAGATSTIQDAEVTDVREGDGGASATVRFRLDGDEHEADLRLTPGIGGWVVDDSGLGALRSTTTIGTAVQVGDAVLPVEQDAALLPGVYPVTAAPRTLLTGTAEVVVLPGDDATAGVTAELRPEATEAAQTQLEAYLTSCTADGTVVPENCGVRIPWGTEFREISDIAFRVERFPAVLLTPTAFTADDGILEATVTGTGQDGAARTVTYRSTAWSVRGGVDVTADELALTVW